MKKKLRILVVDDSQTMRRISKEALSSQFTLEEDTFVEMSDGRQALFWVKMNTPPDVILMDWNMPNMTGIECVRAIRHLGNTTPIVMVTTEREETQILDAVRAGVNSYVVKPFSAQVLCDKVNQAIMQELPAVSKH